MDHNPQTFTPSQPKAETVDPKSRPENKRFQAVSPQSSFFSRYETKAENPLRETENERIEKRLDDMKTTLDNRLSAQEKRLDETLLAMKRPGLPAPSEEALNPHPQKHALAFKTYVRRGDETALRDLETKALLTSATGAEGGFLVSPQAAETIYRGLKTQSEMRSLANVVSTRAGSIEFLLDPDDYGVSWTAETFARTETSTGLLRKTTVPVHELYAMPKATQRLLDDTSFDAEGWIAERVTEKFARTESTAFITGDGVNKPTGILAKTTVANSSWTWGNLGYVPSGAAADFAATHPYDALVETVYNLKPGYRKSAVWLMNSKTAAKIRKFKDLEGAYIWREPQDGATEARILGYPVSINEDMPDVAANAFPVAFGDFKRGYVIVDGPDIRLLRDPYTAKPNVFFYVTKRVGGDVIDFDAIKLLKIATS